MELWDERESFKTPLVHITIAVKKYYLSVMIQHINVTPVAPLGEMKSAINHVPD